MKTQSAILFNASCTSSTGSVIPYFALEGEMETGGAVSKKRFAFRDWLKGLNTVTYNGDDLPE